MRTPRQAHQASDPESERRSALKLAGYAAKKADATGQERNATIWFAAPSGASLREIAEATGIPHVTVKRILDRLAAGGDDGVAVPYAGPDATDGQVEAAALRNVEAARRKADIERDRYEIAVTAAIAVGCSRRDVAAAAGVADTDVERIAEAHNVTER